MVSGWTKLDEEHPMNYLMKRSFVQKYCFLHKDARAGVLRVAFTNFLFLLQF